MHDGPPSTGKASALVPWTSFHQTRAHRMGTVAVELLLPFHHVPIVTVFLDQLADSVAALR